MILIQVLAGDHQESLLSPMSRSELIQLDCSVRLTIAKLWLFRPSLVLKYPPSIAATIAATMHGSAT